MTTITKTVESLIETGILKEIDLVSFVNSKLADSGLTLSGEVPKAVKPSKERPIKKVAATAKKRKAAEAAPAAKKSERAEQSRVEYPDNRSNRHAILHAIHAFGEAGCESGKLRAKLKEIDHEMATNVFHTTRSVMQSKEKLIKSTGKSREKVYKLTVAGIKTLEEFEVPQKDEAQPEAVVEEVTE
jgi:predicted transcriptional regulator